MTNAKIEKWIDEHKYSLKKTFDIDDSYLVGDILVINELELKEFLASELGELQNEKKLKLIHDIIARNKPIMEFSKDSGMSSCNSILNDIICPIEKILDNKI